MNYYIGKNGMFGSQDLQTDKFIFIVKEENPPIGIGGDFEGPFKNLTELKAKSNFYNELSKSNPRTASKLLLPKNINTVEKFVLIPKGKEFDMDLYWLIQHTMFAEFNKNQVQGAHFYNPKNTKIVEIYNRNHLGVIDAKILKLDHDSNTWYEKRSTLFPPNWHEGNALAELEVAYLWRFKILNKENQFGGVTASGVKVIFIFNGHKPKTVYPLI